jgi:hypothetical protein
VFHLVTLFGLWALQQVFLQGQTLVSGAHVSRSYLQLGVSDLYQAAGIDST